VECFLGFANFYKIFIKEYSNIVAPLTKIRGKDKFFWDDEAKKAIKKLKKLLISSPVLIYPYPVKPFFLEANAFEFALGFVLFQ